MADEKEKKQYYVLRGNAENGAKKVVSLNQVADKGSGWVYHDTFDHTSIVTFKEMLRRVEHAKQMGITDVEVFPVEFLITLGKTLDQADVDRLWAQWIIQENKITPEILALLLQEKKK